MSKELIEQLAKEHGSMDMELSTYDFRVFTFSLDQLEAFAKAYQAAAPIDNVAEATWHQLSAIYDAIHEHRDVSRTANDIAKLMRSLIPDTQAKKGE
jgi:hypothetical protein